MNGDSYIVNQSLNQNLLIPKPVRTVETRVKNLFGGLGAGIGFTLILRTLNYFGDKVLSGGLPINFIPHTLTFFGKAAIQESVLLVYDLGLSLLGDGEAPDNGIVRRCSWSIIAKGEFVVNTIDLIASRILFIHTCKEMREKKVAVSEKGYIEIFREALGKTIFFVLKESVPMYFSVTWIRACGYTVFGTGMLAIELNVILFGKIFNVWIASLNKITEKIELHNNIFELSAEQFKGYIKNKIANLFLVPVESLYKEMDTLLNENIENSEEARLEFAKLPRKNNRIDYKSPEFFTFYRLYAVKGDQEFRKWLDIKTDDDIRTYFMQKSQLEESAFNALPRKKNGEIHMGSPEFREYFVTHCNGASRLEAVKEGYFKKLTLALIGNSKQEITDMIRKCYLFQSENFFAEYLYFTDVGVQIFCNLPQNKNDKLDIFSPEFIRYCQLYCKKNDVEFRAWLRIETDEDLRKYHINLSEEENKVFYQLPKKDNDEIDMSTPEFRDYFENYGIPSFEAIQFRKCHEALLNSSDEAFVIIEKDEFNVGNFLYQNIRQSQEEKEEFLKLPREDDGGVSVTSSEFRLYYQIFSRKSDSECRKYLRIETDEQFVKTFLTFKKASIPLFEALTKKENGEVDMGSETFQQFYYKTIGQNLLTPIVNI